ncbi:MAG: carbohydrate-binding protein, partial [Spirochaetes bacterium]|nr:carbohydrate-binding protein [Spirochaetota bacterium]
MQKRMKKKLWLSHYYIIILLLFFAAFLFPGLLVGQEANLALGRRVIENGHIHDFGSWNVNDGNVYSYWEGDNDSASDIVTVDLGIIANITTIVLKLNPDSIWEARTQTIEILGSTNGTDFATLKAENDYYFDPATGNQVSIPVISNVSFVRLVFTYNSSANAGQLAEFEVWGAQNSTNLVIDDGQIIQAEDYDHGVEGTAYHDTSLGNSGGAYRQDDVDIQICSDIGGGFNVGWIRDGEWMVYSVDVVENNYDITARVASDGSEIGDLSVYLDNQLLGTFNVGNTGGWQNYIDLKLYGIYLSGGDDLILKVESVNGGDYNFNYLKFDYAVPVEKYTLQVINGSGSGTYTESAIIPVTANAPPAGKIFDQWIGNTEHLANPDLTSTHVTMPGFDISIEATYNDSSGSNRYEAENAILGGTAQIESEHAGFSHTGYLGGYWQATGNPSATFDVYIETAGFYDLILGYGNGMGDDRTLSIYIDGQDMKQTSLPNLGSWQAWSTKKELFYLTAGNHQVMYKFDADDTGNINLDYIDVSLTTELKPDLVVSSISHSNSDPIIEGDLVVLNANIQNNGTADLINSVTVTFYIDGELMGESNSVTYLAKGNFINLAAPVPWVATPGIHEIRAQVDVMDNATELIEENNTLESQLDVFRKPGPDLVVHDVITNPASPKAGDHVTFTAIIKNNGLDPSDNLEHKVNLEIA